MRPIHRPGVRPAVYPNRPPIVPLKHKRYDAPVTIAAGVLCPDGLVIAADTQYTGTYHAINATKIFGGSYSFGAILFGLAGNQVYGQAAIQKCRQRLSAQAKSVKSDAIVRDIIITTLTRYYKDHIYALPNYKDAPYDYDFQLIVGVYVKGDAPVLYESYHTVIVEVVQSLRGISAIGTGEHLFNFLMKSKTFSPIHSMEEMLLLITSAISRCIDYVPGVGGNVEIAAIRMDGTLTQAKRHDVAVLSKHTMAFEEQAAALLRHMENPGVDDQEFEALLGNFSRELREIRQRWIMDDLVIQMREDLSK